MDQLNVSKKLIKEINENKNVIVNKPQQHQEKNIYWG